jgi:hypothetical protein
MGERVLNEDGEWVAGADANRRSISAASRFRFVFTIVAILGLGIVVCVAAFLLYFGEGAIRPEGSGPTLIVTAKELAQAYRNDPRQADARFKNRTVEVTGEVIAREQPGTHKLSIMMLDDASDVFVNCTVPEENQAQFEGIYPDAVVVIKGICKGTHSGPKMLRVEINNSELVRVVRWTRN